MISLKFVRPHRSIQSLSDISLPDFTIITGINGSGKSHLLESIKNGAIAVVGVSNDGIKLYDWGNLVPAKKASTPNSRQSGVVSEDTADPLALGRVRKEAMQRLAGKFSQARSQFLSRLVGYKMEFLQQFELEAILKITQPEFENLRNAAGAPATWAQFQSALTELKQMFANAFQGSSSIADCIQEYANQKCISLASIGQKELMEALPLEFGRVEMFEQNFSEIFAAYHKAWEDSKYNQFVNSEYGDQRPALSEREFVARFGEPPWDFFNRLLAEANLNYCINRPTGAADVPFKVRLTNKTSNASVSFQDLSSGEKIIMSFTACLYNTRNRPGRINYPSVLLLDEVDAPLHPSMTRDLIRVIENVIVKQKGIKVILTTHSPATVAFSPADSLYRLRSAPRGLEKCSKEDAVQSLTSGYISVTDSSRFVITEAKQDQIVYSRLFKKLVERDHLSSVPNLVFIRASDRQDSTGGGREQVKNWTLKLPEAGLKQIFGLIDRDHSNTASERIKVIGRHSLENYLLDPIVLYAAMMHQGVHTKVLDVGIKDGNYYELREADEAKLQSIVDKMVGVVETSCAPLKTNRGTFEIEYVCGKRVKVPLWLRDHRGHDLEGIVRDAFRTAVEKDFVVTRNECSDLVEIMSERLPEFIPQELVEIFKSLQSS